MSVVFLIVMDQIIQQLTDDSIGINYGIFTTLKFMDYDYLITHTREQMQKIVYRLKGISIKVGLTVNVDKIKPMIRKVNQVFLLESSSVYSGQEKLQKRNYGN